MAKADEEQQPERSFKVQDRRRFAGDESDESARDRVEVDAERGAPGSTTANAERAADAPPPHATGAGPASDLGADAAHELAEMTFSTFVMGLTTQALMHLGEINDPIHPQGGLDLPAAKQMIDLLAILRDKTKGNLDVTEEQLLTNMLYDLRMRYVEVARNR